MIVRHIQGNSSETVTLELGPADVDLPAGVSAVVRDVRPRRVTIRLRRVEPLPAPADSAAPSDSAATADTAAAKDSVKLVPTPHPRDSAAATTKQAS